MVCMLNIRKLQKDIQFHGCHVFDQVVTKDRGAAAAKAETAEDAQHPSSSSESITSNFYETQLQSQLLVNLILVTTGGGVLMYFFWFAIQTSERSTRH